MSQFDAEAFMNSVTTDANSTFVPLIPDGEYNFVITKVEPKSGIISKGEKVGEPWAMLRVTIETEDAAALEGTEGMTKRTHTEGIMLDLTETGSLDMGKGRNVTLGRLREAAGLNRPGEPFAPGMFVGRSVRAHISRRVDPNDSEKFYNTVKGWKPL